MLHVTHPAPNRVDLELDGVLDSGMMAAALDDLVEKSAGVTDGVMLYKITSFEWPTGGAIAAEMMRLPQLFEMIGHFKRCAVVTDTGWIAKAAEIEGRMIPGLEIKAFGFDEIEAAEAWLDAADVEENVPV